MEHSPQMPIVEGPSSIKGTLDKCYTLFRSFPQTSNSSSTTVIRELVQRLDIWTEYTGVWARVGHSLDDRLRDHGDVSTAILGLLRMINSRLETGIFPSFSLVVINIDQ